MQLHLETDELNLLADTLLERIGKATAQASLPDTQASVRLGPHFFDDLLDKVLARDLRLDADELEQVSELLTAHRRKLNEQISRSGDAALEMQIHRRLKLVDRTLEKVDEACVMF